MWCFDCERLQSRCRACRLFSQLMAMQRQRDSLLAASKALRDSGVAFVSHSGSEESAYQQWTAAIEAVEGQEVAK
jgi:hypothetical protein